MNSIGWLNSGIIKALLLALAGLAGLIVRKLGYQFDDDFWNQIIDALLLIVTTGATMYAGYARATKATPPITQMAVDATAARVAEEKKQGGRSSISMLSALAGLSLMALMVMSAGCAALNPVSKANTLEQKAYALYGSFVVFEEQAAVLVQKPGTSVSVKTALANADALAKPLAERLIDAAQSVLAIRLEIEAGASIQDKLVIALDNLDRYIAEAGPKIKALGQALKEAA